MELRAARDLAARYEHDIDGQDAYLLPKYLADVRCVIQAMREPTAQQIAAALPILASNTSFEPRDRAIARAACLILQPNQSADVLASGEACALDMLSDWRTMIDAASPNIQTPASGREG